MRVNATLGLVIAGSVATMVYAARERDKPAPKKPPPRVAERPWLSHEDAAQVVAEDGALGPLFEGITIGGSGPTPEQRAKVQAFARAHSFAIDFQMHDHELVGIHLDVSYGGCCGYEGADWLANRLGRWSTGVCCVCGPDTLVNDWAQSTAGVHLSGHVRVNRVEATWAVQLSADELVERADAMLGKVRGKIAIGPNEHWTSLGDGTYRLSLAYPTTGQHRDFGIVVRTERGVIHDVSIDAYAEDLESALTAFYGRQHHDESWRRGDHIVRHDYDYVFERS